MRGYQKRVIYLKNTGSSLFEGAYFIVKADNKNIPAKQSDMVQEANRIIKENFTRRTKTPAFIWYMVAFLVGVITSSLLYILLF